MQFMSHGTGISEADVNAVQSRMMLNVRLSYLGSAKVWWDIVNMGACLIRCTNLEYVKHKELDIHCFNIDFTDSEDEHCVMILLSPVIVDTLLGIC